jgi:hypothetical protein
MDKVNMGDLSKVDFTKLVLPEWKQRNCVVRISAEDVTVEWMLVPGWIAKKLSGVWLYATDCSSFDELLELKKVSEKVDAFIATELKELEPEWVEIKPSEVGRLRKAGANVRHVMSEDVVKGLLGNVIARVHGAELCAVDVKTVPPGVKLYEPEWIDVPWQEVEELDKRGATTMARAADCRTDDWVSRGALRGYTGSSKFTYRADRKTCPDGYRPTVGEVVFIELGGMVGLAKPLHATIESTGTVATLATNVPYDTSKGVSLGGVLAPGTWKIIAVRGG